MNAESIICAVDVNHPARSLARCAGWLAETLNLPLELVYVLDEGALPALPRHGRALDPVVRNRLQARQEDRARIRAVVELAATAAELPRVRVSHVVLDGQAVPALQERAVQRDATLLVTATAAREGLEHVLQGSVSGSIAARAACPVVIVPPEARVGEPGPVLVGDDGSDHGRRATKHAAALAQRMSRDLVRMHVRDRNPVEAIGDAAREQRACLVVVGTRGRGPLRAELFGSVSIGLVQTSARPVVLVAASAHDPA